MRPFAAAPALLAGSCAVALGALGACGSSGSQGAPPVTGADATADALTDASGADVTSESQGGEASLDASLPLGAPITTTPEQWTWVDFPDSACDDGTPTGIGVYRTASSDKLLLLFGGGGACWDYFTCVTVSASLHGPYGAAQFNAFIASPPTDSILDRASSLNPFKDYNVVYIPYCTSDTHGGSRVATYTSGADSRTFHHVGHENVMAYLARVAATFKTPTQLTVAGPSAGGAGALFNYVWARAYFPTAPSILLDDSLPLFQGDSLPPAFRAAWFASWDLGKAIAPLCGTACADDLSLVMSNLATRYPNDRMGLLSSMQDKTIRTFYLQTGSQYQTNLTALASGILDPTPNFRHFFVPGESHTMVAAIGNFTSQGVPLGTWLARMVNADPAWASVGP